jgi:hypothetical protein
MSTVVAETSRMDAVAPPATGRGERVRQALPSLLALALMGGLLPLRSSWAVDLVLIVLSLTVPGLLALRAVRVSGDAMVGYPIYIPAASLFVMMAGGLLVDVAGPSVGIRLPLHGVATALTVIGVSAVLWIVGLFSPATARLDWRPLLGRPTLFIPFALPALAAAGALLLSNGHGPDVARNGRSPSAARRSSALTSRRRSTSPRRRAASASGT